MANIKVSELNTATAFNDADYMMIVQSGENKKITGAYINGLLNNLDDKFGGVLLKSDSGITNATVKTSAGYGTLLIVSSQFVCVIQFSGSSYYIKDIFGTHGTMQITVGSNYSFELTDLYDWDHYIFIGSNVITEIDF